MMTINLLGVGLIALIVWWFWLYKPQKTIIESDEVLIEVKDGVYSPSFIQVSASHPVILKFKRSDQTPCAETMLIPSLDISEQLKLNEITQITLANLSPGEHEFHCQMQMYRGVLKVV
ncbi:cupredoxin domain-containing protein [Aliiglaciecola sp. LCG003]|uniref:cupredoxin domain-containing protein n=1 Tax=Aliiglaciecola sp. LCG003 TaxID=3053655 RepID=UPI0025728839|nr:cupredoxin domain-containing protein [Aliiglaciecola sp. LCG003]WJG10263.1 cupredoxin domain-containing protein [Aliiglaciecola sp. LCG003]